MKGDLCEQEGATRLAAQIREYWARKGGYVETRLIPGPFCAAMRTARMDVRSDMVNGLPRKRIPRMGRDRT